MNNISKSKLVQGLQILYRLWNRDFEDKWPSHYHIEFRQGEPYDFFKKYSKQLGLGHDVDDYYFWMNGLEQNEDELDKGTLTENNVVVPTWNTFDVTTSESRVEQVTVFYEGEVEGYFTRGQLLQDFYDLSNEDIFDIYNFTESDRDYGDSESHGIELNTISLVNSETNESVKQKKVIKESNFDSFIDSLTEDEAKFLISKLQRKFL